MSYGEKVDLENIEERRKQRLMERNANGKELQSILDKGVMFRGYGLVVAGILFPAALAMYWLVSPFASLFVLIISVGVHMHLLAQWLHTSIRSTLVDHVQIILHADELFDDLQELLAKQAKREDKST